MVKLKNRSTKALFQGYRDFLLNLQLTLPDGTKHVCELQVHFRKIKLLGIELKSHETYEFFRSFFMGNMKAVADRLGLLFRIDRKLGGKLRTGSCDEIVEDVIGAVGQGISWKDLAELGSFMGLMSRLDLSGKLGTTALAAVGVGDRGRDDPLERSAVLLNMGKVLIDQGKPGQALEEYLEPALAIRKKLLGEEDLAVAEVQHNMARAYIDWGKLGPATAMNDAALAVRKRHGGADLGSTLHNIGRVLIRLGKNEEARQTWEQALEVRTKALGPKHRLVAMTVNNLGNVLLNMGQMEAGMARYQEALKIRIQVYGEEHREVAQGLQNIAIVLESQGKHDGAEQKYKRALAIYDKCFGGEHFDVVCCC